MHITMKSIGTIHTPYIDKAPYQPLKTSEESFYLELDPKYQSGLHLLEKFQYIFVFFYAHQKSSTIPKNLSIQQPQPLLSNSLSPDPFSPFPHQTMKIPWAPDINAGIFATRSPFHPNKIALSIVRLLSIVENKIFVSSIDAFNDSPLLDIKPYLKTLDSKADANDGWVDDLSQDDHLSFHLRGIPH